MSEAFTAKLRGSVSLLLSSSPAAFHVCRTESDRVGLEMQATCFGKTSPKSAFFFFKTSDPGSSDSLYYAVGDALWQLEITRSRSYFLKFAQAEWTWTYRDNVRTRATRAALFTRPSPVTEG